MRHILIPLSILLFIFTIFSCSEKDEHTTTTDTTSPVIAEVTAVTTPTNDSTPNYTFSSSEAGTITYGGSCSSSTTSATTDNNTITFSTLDNGTYSNCTITVTDSAVNVSNTLEITDFTVTYWQLIAKQVTAITSLMALMNSFHQMPKALSWKMIMIPAVPPSCPLEI